MDDMRAMDDMRGLRQLDAERAQLKKRLADWISKSR
jgi:hypothetical protein